MYFEPLMNGSTSIAATSKENLAQRYLQLQRLRQLVQEAIRDDGAQ